MGDSRAVFRLLGPVSVWHDGAPVALGGPRHRRLLAVLLLDADHVVPTGRLVEALWGDQPPASAPAMVHVRVSELRATLRPFRPDGQAGVVNEAGGYVLRLGDDELDSDRFAELVADGLAARQRGDAVAALTHLTAGLALWRGPALGEFHDEAFAAVGVGRLESLWHQAWEARIQAELDQGRHAQVIGELEAAVREQPLREPLWGHLMTALYRAGRQSDALAAFGRARAELADQLGLDPGPQLQAMHRAVLNHDPDLLGPAPAAALRTPAAFGSDPPPGNLPTPLTTFVGRAGELADVLSTVGRSRLVSITGVGGVGKSRLAVEVGLRSRPDFPAGVWWVELAAVQQPGLVAQVVAATLGLREHGRRETVQLLIDHLADAEALIVFDNCEHLLMEVADLVNELLAACSRVRVLTTTRERLSVDGEVLRPLTGLSVSASALTDPAMIRQYDAVRLFEDRARAARPDFVLSATSAAAAADVCRQLDGLPLAIELAAARANALSVADIAARLDDRFRLLRKGTPSGLPRHQTLRAAVDWSFELLSPREQILFARLSVFVGGFTLDAAETLGADDGHDDPTVTELLVALIDKSLVAMSEPGTGPQRYWLLETMRVYGGERLDRSGERNAIGARHAAYYLGVVKNARSALLGPGQAAQLRLLEVELGNIRAALAWLLRSGETASALHLAGWLYPLWDRHGHYQEGRRWLTRALATNETAPSRARARALDSAAGLALIQGDHETAGAEADQAAALSRQIGDWSGLAQALTTRGLAAIYADRVPEATEMLQEALQVARTAGDRHAEASSIVYLMTAFLAAGDYDRTRRLSDEATVLLDRLGDPEGLAWTGVLRGAAAWRLGDRDDATRSLRPGLVGFADLGHVVGLSVGVFACAQLTAETSWDDAIVLLAASEALRESVGAALLPFARPWLQELTTRATDGVGDAGFDRLWRTGTTLPTAAVVDRAIRQLGDPPAGRPHSPGG
jgi:predicted ATPase/DNA-binding SARP family transcriptional activator